jgi:hypothetical protein
MRALPAAAVVLVAFAAVPAAALAANGQAHGPSATPLIVELLVLALGTTIVLGRHALARLIRSVAHALAHARNALAHHQLARGRASGIR